MRSFLSILLTEVFTYVHSDPASNEQVKTGNPIKISFRRRIGGTPNMGTRFGQHIEPSGEYMIDYNFEQGFEKFKGEPKVVFGYITFMNPLVIDYDSTREKYEHGWKGYLFDKYKAKKQKLSDKIKEEGHDGIITMSKKYGMSEIVNLSANKEIVKEL